MLFRSGSKVFLPETSQAGSHARVFSYLVANEPEIGDVDKGVVEGSEDTGNAEDELACAIREPCQLLKGISPPGCFKCFDCLPSRVWGPRETFSAAAAGAFLLGGMLSDIW